jgi:hypothetical protein
VREHTYTHAGSGRQVRRYDAGNDDDDDDDDGGYYYRGGGRERRGGEIGLGVGEFIMSHVCFG